MMIRCCRTAVPGAPRSAGRDAANRIGFPATPRPRPKQSRQCRRTPPRFRERRRPPAGCAQASYAGAPHDLEQPALGVAVAIAVEIAKCSQTSLLHDIGGIGIVARQPSRERVGGIEMGQRYRLEPRLTTPIGVPRHLPLRNLPRFLDTVDLGRGHVETTGTPKATEPLF